MSTETSRIQAVKDTIEQYISDTSFTISTSDLQHVAEQITWAHERNFENVDEISDEDFVEDIEQSWNERLIEAHLIPPTEEYEESFTEGEHGIDATLTVWAKGTNLTSEGDNAGHYDQDGPGNPLEVSYVDGAFTASTLSAYMHTTVVITANFVPTQEEVISDGDFSAVIEVHREKREDDPEIVEILDLNGGGYLGEIPITYED